MSKKTLHVLSCIAIIIFNTYANAATLEEYIAKTEQQRRDLVRICDSHLTKTSSYNQQIRQCGSEPSSEIFQASTLYELTLREDVPLSALEEALELGVKERAIIQAFFTVWCYKKGCIETQKELLLKKHAQPSISRFLRIAPKDHKDLLETNHCAEVSWPAAWSAEEHTRRAYALSFKGGACPLPETEAIGAEHDKRYGHFDPKLFLEKMHTPLTLLTHLEEEHARLLTYAFLPMLCNPINNGWLTNTLSQCIAPDKTFLSDLATKAQALHQAYTEAPITYAATTCMILQELETFLSEHAQSLSPQEWSCVENTCNVKTLVAKELAIVRMLKHLIDKDTSLSVREKANSAASELVAITTYHIGEKAIEEEVSFILNNYGFCKNITQLERINQAVMEEKADGFIAAIVQATYTRCVCILQRRGSTQIPEKAPKKLLESITNKLREALFVPDHHKALLDGIWAIFDEFQVNVSPHQWKCSTLLLKELPRIKAFSTKKPKETAMLFAYRERPGWQNSTFTRRIDYYNKVIREGLPILLE